MCALFIADIALQKTCHGLVEDLRNSSTRSTLVVVDEFGMVVGTMGAFSKSAGAASADLSRWLTLYSSGNVPGGKKCHISCFTSCMLGMFGSFKNLQLVTLSDGCRSFRWLLFFQATTKCIIIQNAVCFSSLLFLRWLPCFQWLHPCLHILISSYWCPKLPP